MERAFSGCTLHLFSFLVGIRHYAARGRYLLIDTGRYERFTFVRWWNPEYGSVSNPEGLSAVESYSLLAGSFGSSMEPASTLVVTVASGVRK